MPTSITGNKKWLVTGAAVAFWLLVWQVAAAVVGKNILLPPPLVVARSLCELAVTQKFWSSVSFSVVRIFGGFLLGLVAGALLAAASSVSRVVRALMAVPMGLMKSIPVASFIIVLLLWVPSRSLAVPLTFFMVAPVIYQNILEGILSIDRESVEMATVFRVGLFRRARFIYLSHVLPFFSSACRSALGLCWKAGVAAEVIGLPRGSIGMRLYESKIYLETGEMFAWTAVIVVISVAFERAFMYGVKILCRRLSGVRA